MVVPCVLTCSIDIKLGVFPEGTSIFDTAKSPRDFFAEEAQFKVVAIQQCPNHIAHVTFREGGRLLSWILRTRGLSRFVGLSVK